MLIIMFILSLIISMMLIFVNSLTSTKYNKEREKLSSFECGFDPKSLARLPFSLHFFLIALIFLIFDVEITLILPLPISFFSSVLSYWNSIMVILVFVLVGGTLIEWMEGSLDWSY